MTTTKSTGVRVPVKVDGDLYQTFKSYSDVTGVPMAHVVREALQDFAETTLAARLETLQETTHFV